MDVKYSLTPSLTLDATYNTDFAQVEVDDQQINLDRFNLFFPEKRPFFLENAGLFSVGIERRGRGVLQQGDRHRPRRWNDSDHRRRPAVGSRRRQHERRHHQHADGEQEVRGLPANNFSVARVQHELPNRSAVGAIFVNRQATGDLARRRQLQPQLCGRRPLWIRPERPGQRVCRRARRRPASVATNTRISSASRTTRKRGGWVRATLRSGKTSTPRSASCRATADFARSSSRSTGTSVCAEGSFWKFHELRPHAGYNAYWNFDGLLETGRMHIDQHWQLRAGHEFHTGMNLTREGVTIPFEIYPGIFVPVGTYDHSEAQLVAFTNQGAPLSVRMRITFGGFFGGSRVNVAPELRFRFERYVQHRGHLEPQRHRLAAAARL